ncbi:MAG: hydrogenase maturation nickel metallochaperone HypA [Methanomicrobiales archaeon]|nr:hydrogenase maturation nickel metallochaperone HypA [Methanomicrobiales archaeon]
MACSAGGPMEITILDVDEEDTKCNDCGKKFRRPKRKARCPECGSENLGAL